MRSKSFGELRTATLYSNLQQVSLTLALALTLTLTLTLTLALTLALTLPLTLTLALTLTQVSSVRLREDVVEAEVFGQPCPYPEP